MHAQQAVVSQSTAAALAVNTKQRQMKYFRATLGKNDSLGRVTA